MITEKVLEHTIGAMVISIKDSGRMATKKDMGYSNSRLERYKKENFKEARHTVTLIQNIEMMATQVSNIKGRIMV